MNSNAVNLQAFEVLIRNYLKTHFGRNTTQINTNRQILDLEKAYLCIVKNVATKRLACIMRFCELHSEVQWLERTDMWAARQTEGRTNNTGTQYIFICIYGDLQNSKITFPARLQYFSGLQQCGFNQELPIVSQCLRGIQACMLNLAIEDIFPSLHPRVYHGSCLELQARDPGRISK